MAESKNILEIRDLHKNFFIKGQKLPSWAPAAAERAPS